MTEGLAASEMVAPASEQEAAELLHRAARDGAVVCPWGAGSMQELGNLPERADLVLSLERLHQVVEYEPADLFMTVQAGMRLADLQALAGRHGQMLAADPRAKDLATVGGVIAANATGPCRLAYGGPRDWLLGARVALADGRVIRTGGRVVKNVAGYDLNKLLVGSLGTLGVMTEVTVKLRPLPEARRTLLFGHPDLARALAVAEAMLNSELLPTALTVLTPGAAARLGAPGPVCLAALFEETAENVAYQCSRLPWPEADDDIWDGIRNYDRPCRIRVETVISEIEGHLRWAESRGWDGIAHVGTGTVLLYGTEMPDRSPGVVEKAPLEWKRGRDVFGPPRLEWAIMRAIKAQFDPGRVLNRGRFVGGI